MNETEVQTIIDCLPKGKTKFYYFKDRYAQMLLSYYAGSGLAVSRIKKTNFGKLLNNSLIKSLMTKAGDGLLTSTLLNSVWPRHYECYLLTLGQWGSKSKRYRYYDQTTRSGYNLVLQLNFSARHNRPYDDLIQPTEWHPFVFDSHPIARQGYHTLAWSRLDINLDSGQALIEEVQNDWLREALSAKEYVLWLLSDKTKRTWGDSWLADNMNCQPQDVIKYVNRILLRYVKLWDEAMLAATIWFLRHELGIRTIFYHTYDSGRKLKKMTSRYSQPPRSIYTDLPRKFCFEKTNSAPEWLVKDKRKRKRPRKSLGTLTFWRLSL